MIKKNALDKKPNIPILDKDTQNQLSLIYTFFLIFMKGSMTQLN